MIINSKIRGISFNENQQNAKKLKPGQQIFLKLEPENKFDPNAVHVYAGFDKTTRKFSESLGYVGKELAKDITNFIKSAKSVSCFVNEITGLNAKNLGVNIRFIVK